MPKAYVLVRHFDFDAGVDALDLGDGRFQRIAQNANGRQLLERCRTLFPDGYAQFSDWLYERDYAVTPPARIGGDASGFGDIPYQTEDLLVALRLLQPGDICFVAQALAGEDGRPWFQQPYRFFGQIASTHPYHFHADQVPAILELLRVLKGSVGGSKWFSVAKRFFLFGGGKEFNPYIDELDRIVDLVIALEAALVFEKDFVNRLLRNRAIQLLGLQGDEAKKVKRLLGDFYGYRSTIAHGDPLPIADPAETHRQMWEFEELTRRILRAALAAIPAADDARKQKLSELASVSDQDRIAFLIERTKPLQDDSQRQAVLAALGA